MMVLHIFAISIHFNAKCHFCFVYVIRMDVLEYVISEWYGIIIIGDSAGGAKLD